MWLLICSSGLLLFTFAGGLTMRKKGTFRAGAGWKEKLFGPGADFLLKLIRKEDPFFKKVMPEILGILWMLHLLVWCLILSGVVVLSDVSVSQIERNSYSGGDKKEILYAETENGEEVEVEVLLGSREYSEEEIDGFFREVREKLPEYILGENESLEKVSYELNLVSGIPGNPVSISWEPLTDDFSELSSVTAVLTLQNREEEFVIPFCYVEPEKSAEVLWKEELEDELRTAEEESRTAEYLKLPRKVDGIGINWLRKGSGNVEGMVFLMFVAAGLVFWKEKDKLQKQEEYKKGRMILEYPELVSRITLLLGAGMTLQRAWEKIATEYRTKREKGSISLHYSYEEMYLTYKQMESGISLKTAVDAFGKRIGIPRYLKFSTLLVQNLRRGSVGLLERLEIEAVDSFEERKAIARQMGEKAGTKLLFPMMLMLVIVMVLIMVPAFLSFNM